MDKEKKKTCTPECIHRMRNELMENNNLYHYKAPSEAEYNKAKQELT